MLIVRSDAVSLAWRDAGGVQSRGTASIPSRSASGSTGSDDDDGKGVTLNGCDVFLHAWLVRKYSKITVRAPDRTGALRVQHRVPLLPLGIPSNM
jgi:hypothetical protein